MDKWNFAAKHGWASATGWVRYFFAHGGFAFSLLRARAHFFRRRQLAHPLAAPGGFAIDTPDTLIAYWSMFVERELHDSVWVDSLNKAVRPLVLDVGANAGVFSFFVHHLNPTSEIIAFEPLPAMSRRVQALAKRAAMNLVVHEKAVSNQPGTAYLESPQGYEGTSHLVAQATPPTGALQVETVTLDDVILNRPIELIKIDVEGFECEVLAGAKKTVDRAKHLIIEAQTPDHLARVTASLGSSWRRKRLGMSDYLFYR